MSDVMSVRFGTTVGHVTDRLEDAPRTRSLRNLARRAVRGDSQIVKRLPQAPRGPARCSGMRFSLPWPSFPCALTPGLADLSQALREGPGQRPSQRGSVRGRQAAMLCGEGAAATDPR